MSGEAVFKSRGCVSCHNNSLPAMTVALARKKGFLVNEEQARKELGFAVATDLPFLEPMRLGSTIGGGTDTLGYTLMGMAAAGYPADALTDSHIHYLSIYQFPDGAWRTTSYRPPEEYGPFTTTAVALRAIRLYPIPGRREEFEDRFARARRWLLSAKAISAEERVHATQRIGRRRRQRLRTRAVREGPEGCSKPGRELEPAPGHPGRRICHWRSAVRAACLGQCADTKTRFIRRACNGCCETSSPTDRGLCHASRPSPTTHVR